MTATARRRWTATATAALLWLPLAGCGGDDEAPFLKDGMRVGAKSDQPGTSYSPHDGEFNGLDMTVTRELLGRAGVEPPYFSGVLSKNRGSALRDGHLDLVAATYSITADRMKPEEEGGEDLDFVGPYASTQQGVLVRSADADELRNLGDLNGKQVCVWRGTTSATEMKREAYRKISVRTEEDAGYCVKALLAKEVDAVSTDRLILYGFMEEHPSLKVVPGIKFNSVPNDYGIAMAKGHREDCEKLRDLLTAYVDSADWDRDVQNNLPAMPRAERDEAKPTAQEISDLSCRDKPANSGED
ncbi:transporter substrate-binding domain-containing protein [Streptomyces sp. NPDC059002]|uniref:transporter substrate-binding domain-containing protein n=1 Tax=Streptomyces sp. NPDC059002 TaxID=3346690 RepID=UPI00367C0F4C